jgi:hypothetical protein
MQARGLGSPDRADAVLGAMMEAQIGDLSFSRVEVPERGEFRVASMSPRR